jgi:O-antigen/teichoic acid export membrane protein
VNRSFRSKDGLFGTLVVSAVIALASLCSGMILARSLSPELRGVLATIILWPTMLGIFGDLGLGFAVSYYAAKEPGSSSALWTTSLVYGLAAGALFGAAGAWLLPQFLELADADAFYLRLTMSVVPAALVANYASMLLLGSGWIREYNLIRAYLSVSYALGIVALAALNRAEVHGFTLAYIAAQLSGAVLATGLVLWRIRPRLAWSWPLLKPMFVYGGKTYISSVVAQTNLRLDQMIMSAVVPFAALGNYVVAVAMSSTIGPIYTTLAIVALPRVTHQPDSHSGGLEGTRYFKLGVLAGIPLAIVGLLAMRWLLPLLFGDQYAGAVLPAQILMVAAISQGLNIVLGNSLRGLGRPGLPAIAESIGVIVTVTLLLVTLPIWGVVGAAATSLLAYSAVMLAQMVFINRYADLPWRAWWLSNWRDLLPNVSLAGIRRRPAATKP